MSEHEKFEQVGRLAEEYSKLKGELNHVSEKLSRIQLAYQFVGQAFNNITVQNDQLVAGPGASRFQPKGELHALASAHELKEAILERDRLTRELKETGDRLTALAPHLIR